MNRRGNNGRTRAESAALKEKIKTLLALGLSSKQVAFECGVCTNYVWKVAGPKNKGIKLKDRVKALLDSGMTDAREISATLGFKHVQQVYVIFHDLGIHRGIKKGGDTAFNRRGFRIPPERMPEYRALRRLGLTFEECGWEMGLLERPKAPYAGKAKGEGPKKQRVISGRRSVGSGGMNDLSWGNERPK